MATKKDKTSKIKFRAEEVESYMYCAKKWEFDKIYQIIREYKKGSAVPDISNSFGYSENFIKNVLKQFKYI